MQTVFIVGSGAMGTGIAQLCGQAGYRVFIMDINRQALSEALKKIEWSLHKLEKKNLPEGATSDNLFTHRPHIVVERHDMIAVPAYPSAHVDQELL